MGVVARRPHTFGRIVAIEYVELRHYEQRCLIYLRCLFGFTAMKMYSHANQFEMCFRSD